MNRYKLFVCIGLLTSLSVPAQDVYRVWKSKEGVAIQAHLVSADAEHVTLKLMNGTVSTVKIDRLIQADQDFIRQSRGIGGAAVSSAGRRAEWNDQLNAALAESVSTGKPVLFLFTGSDWCPYCIQLEKNVLSHQEFSDFADKNLVLMKVDRTRRRPPSKKLAAQQEGWMKQYGVSGYPTMLLLDAKGDKIQQFGYGGQDAEKFIAMVKRMLPKS